MLEVAEEYNPDNPALYLGKAYNHRVFGEAAEEQAALNQVIHLGKEDSSDSGARFDRALAYEALGDYETALREYQSIISMEEQEKYFVAYLSAARVLIEMARFDEAQAQLDQAREHAGENAVKLAWLHIDQGTLKEKQGQYEEAINAYRQALAFKDDLVTAHYHLARLYAAQGMADAALLTYEEIVDLSDNKGWAHDIYGQFLYDIAGALHALD